LITFLFPGIATATSINMHVPCLLSPIVMPSILLGIVLSVRAWWFRNKVTLPSILVSIDFSTWSYQYLFSDFTPISLHMLKCNWAHYYYYYYIINCNNFTWNPTIPCVRGRLSLLKWVQGYSWG
jgi:hypothetical protein